MKNRSIELKSEAEKLDDQLNDGKYTSLYDVHHCLHLTECFYSSQMCNSDFDFLFSSVWDDSVVVFVFVSTSFLLHRHEAPARRCSKAIEGNQNQTESADEEPDSDSEQPQLNYKYNDAHSVHKTVTSLSSLQGLKVPEVIQIRSTAHHKQI